MAKKSTFWAAVSVAVSAVPAAAAGAVSGIKNSVTGDGTFKDGFEKTGNALLDKAEEFGAEHGEQITNGLLRGAAVAVGGAAVNKGLKHTN